MIKNVLSAAGHAKFEGELHEKSPKEKENNWKNKTFNREK